jgi:hypothetical protein
MIFCHYNIEKDIFKFITPEDEFYCNHKGEEVDLPIEDITWKTHKNPKRCAKIPKEAIEAAVNSFDEYRAAIEWENSSEFKSWMGTAMENDTW